MTEYRMCCHGVHYFQAVESLKVSDTTDSQMDHLRQQIEIESSRAESLEKQKKSMQETIASLAEREVCSFSH